jgi:hypothetical protein
MKFISEHLSEDERALLLSVLESAHQCHTKGPTVSARLDTLVIHHLDTQTADRYYKEFLRRLRGGETMVRATNANGLQRASINPEDA